MAHYCLLAKQTALPSLAAARALSCLLDERNRSDPLWLSHLLNWVFLMSLDQSSGALPSPHILLQIQPSKKQHRFSQPVASKGYATVDPGDSLPGDS